MFSRLPIIVSVPHGGKIIAPEIHDRTLLTREDIFSDGDPLTREICNFKKNVQRSKSVLWPGLPYHAGQSPNNR